MSSVTYFLVLLTIVVAVKAQLVCPGFGFVRPQEPCVDECSTANDTCSSGKKCCYTPLTPCGYRCLVGKVNVTKPGVCPSRESNQEESIWLLCDANLCDVDGDCPCKEKCCSNRCGSNVCIAPVKSTVKKG